MQEKRIPNLPKIIGHFGELPNPDQLEFQQHILLKSYLNRELFLELRAQKEKEEKEENGEITQEFNNEGEIDFRNYVFSDAIFEDSNSLIIEDQYLFEPDDNVTEDGRYLPRPYRLTFSTDIAYSPSIVASTYGTFAFTQFIVSDLLGDHQLSFGTNFQTDLRNSDYTIQYGYFKNRTNYSASFFHHHDSINLILGNFIGSELWV